MVSIIIICLLAIFALLKLMPDPDAETIESTVIPFIETVNEDENDEFVTELVDSGIDLFGIHGSIIGGYSDDGFELNYIDIVRWKSDEKCSQDQLKHAEGILNDVYGKSTSMGEDYNFFDEMIPSYCIWETDEYDYIICGLNEDKRLVVAWFYNLDNVNIDTNKNKEDTTALETTSITTFDEILEEKKNSISRFIQLFEELNIPYEVLPDGETIIGEENEYKILDTDYSVSVMVNTIYSKEENRIQTAFNLSMDYHIEKGIDKENPYIQLAYNAVTQRQGTYGSIDEMVDEMNSTDEKIGVGFAWEIKQRSTFKTIDFTYVESEESDYQYPTLSYVSFDNMDARNNTKEEYKNLVEQRLTSNGYLNNSIVRAQIRDGWENDTYARDIDNNLGIVVRFNEIDTTSENISTAVEIVKIYIDCAKEIFNIDSPYSSDLLAKDIVSRARLKEYNGNYNQNRDGFRLCENSEESEKVNLPCFALLDKNINPLLNIQYIESGYFIDTLGWYSAEPNTIIIEYYIPIQVEGLKNK